MYLKANGCSFGVFLIHTVTVTCLLAGVWCETPPEKPNSHLAPHHVRSRAAPTSSLSYEAGGGARGPQLGNRADPSGGEQRAGPGDTLFKNLHSLKAEPRVFSALGPADENCGRGRIRRLVHGTFDMTGQLEVNVAGAETQSEPGPAGRVGRTWGQQVRSSEESWQRLQPVVECGDDAMTLRVRRRRAAQLQLDRVKESSVPLTQLPPQCGYSVQTMFTDLSLRVQYNGCHVSHEDDRYVLRLLWRGTPVKVSCPVLQLQPQDTGLSSLCCSSSGMTVRLQGPSAAEELRVKVRGQWTPLMEMAEQCGYILDRRQAESVISAPFVTCGITVQDGQRTISLQIGRKMFELSCPISPSHDKLLQTREPLTDISHHRIRELREAVPESSEPFLWAPPFYLAPLHYPHPTNHHRYPTPYGHDAYNPPTSSTPAPAFDPQLLLNSQDSPHILARLSNEPFSPHSSASATDEKKDLSREYPDFQQMEETSVISVSESSRATASSFLTEAPSLQPSSHVFNPYYHYYHHPKIPFPGPPQNPGPGPEVARELSSTNPHTEIPVLPVCDQESDINSDLLPHLVFWSPYMFPTNPEFVHKTTGPYVPTFPLPHPYPPSPPQPYPHNSYFFPYTASSEAKKVSPLHPDMTAETLSDIPSLPRKYDMNPFISHLHEMRNKKHSPFSEEDLKRALYDIKGRSALLTPLPHVPHPVAVPPPGRPSVPTLPPSYLHRPHAVAVPPPGWPSVPTLPPSYPHIPHAVAVPPPGRPSVPTPLSDHHPPPYLYYFCPDVHYYNGPGILHSSAHHLSPAPTKPLEKHPTSAPATISQFDVPNPLLNPYYHYYRQYYQPGQDLHPGASMDSRAAGSPLQPGNSRPDQLARAHEAGYAGLPQPLYSPFHGFYPNHVPLDLPGHQSGEKDRLKANAAAAPPCVFGPGSDSDCSNSLGCCSYRVHDCTVGRHFVLVLPDCVLEPTLAPPAHPSEGHNVSCSLEKLTSDPDVYIVPLVGCGVSTHEFSDTVVHWLEVHGIRSSQTDNASGQQNAPVRLMVECISSPGSPDEVRLHVMAQPPPAVHPPPPIITVQLRIATDQSYTSYHLETHLPLSLLRGKPLYLEVSLLDPPELGLVLLVHSCLAYTHTPFISWMPVYDGCSSQSKQLLPSPRSDSHHIQRIVVSSFLSLTSESLSDMARRGSSRLEDPEIPLPHPLITWIRCVEPIRSCVCRDLENNQDSSSRGPGLCSPGVKQPVFLCSHSAQGVVISCSKDLSLSTDLLFVPDRSVLICKQQLHTWLHQQHVQHRNVRKEWFCIVPGSYIQ